MFWLFSAFVEVGLRFFRGVREVALGVGDGGR